MRKNKIKMLMLSLCAVLLGVVCAYGTMAYLYDKDVATNTFTVGKVAITLDETDVDGSTPNQERDQENKYHLLPGWNYKKDPTVHVETGSEDCYVYVKVLNGMVAYEAIGDTTIANQIEKNGWTALAVNSNIYWKEYHKADDQTDFVVFDQFKVSGAANDVSGWNEIAASEDCKIIVTAYAIQSKGFTDALDAWNHTFGTNP